ncbi:MAG: hypothetical protein KatS3mg076_0486 [Candidatus Binatia bacterium]|nr:MAG: hypothetical protein KatS3mg076_0486 [Candidatus Binatia bacterium]
MAEARRRFASVATALLCGAVVSAAEARWVENVAATVTLASWYGPRFEGKTTASGRPFDPARLTAAHRTYPLGSDVRVTNLRNGRSLILKIDDRGPFVEGRGIDLSREAARRLGILEPGVGRVVVELLPSVPDLSPVPTSRRRPAWLAPAVAALTQ